MPGTLGGTCTCRTRKIPPATMELNSCPVPYRTGQTLPIPGFPTAESVSWKTISIWPSSSTFYARLARTQSRMESTTMYGIPARTPWHCQIRISWHRHRLAMDCRLKTQRSEGWLHYEMRTRLESCLASCVVFSFCSYHYCCCCSTYIHT